MFIMNPYMSYGMGPMPMPQQGGSGGKIVLILFLLLVLAGIGVGIYFAVKASQESEESGTEPSPGPEPTNGDDNDDLPNKTLYSVYSTGRKDTCSSLDEHCSDKDVYNGTSTPLGKIFAEQVSGTIPLYSSFSSSRKDTCISKGENCNGQKNTGGNYNSDNGVVGYVYKEDKGDDYEPIYRTYSSSRSDSCVSLDKNCGDKNIYDGTPTELGYVYTG